ncbi:MAG: hypothetical protein QXQ02_03290 [Halobacteria archaeon]
MKGYPYYRGRIKLLLDLNHDDIGLPIELASYTAKEFNEMVNWR